MGTYLDHDSLYIVKDRSSNSSNVYLCPAHRLPYGSENEGTPEVTAPLQWDDHGIRFWDGSELPPTALPQDLE
jgi:hypothetical protein